MSFRRLISVGLVLGMIVSAFAVTIGNVSANQGAKDTFGYRWTDNKVPGPNVTFNWIEINSTGTNSNVVGDDTYGGPFPIGFTFNFYGNDYTQFYISTNGFISFSYGSSDLSPDSIPSTSSPNNYIASYWDDMYVRTPGGVYYQIVGTAPNQQLVVEFLNLTEYGSSNRMAIEIILNQTGDIWFQYLKTSGMTANWATVGIENSAGQIGCQYSHYTACLVDGLAIRFSLPELIIAPDQAKSGKPGDTLTYDITVTNRQSSSDSVAIAINSSTWGASSVYDEFMNPLTDTDGDGLPDTGTLAQFESKNLKVTVDIPSSPPSDYDYTVVNATSHSDPALNDTCTLTTKALSAWLTPPHVDYGVDTDSDDLFNYLVVNVSLNVRTAGSYSLSGNLYNTMGWSINSAWNSSFFTAGQHYLLLRYHGWFINAQAYNPSYVNLDLYDASGLIDQGVHDLGTYSPGQFMQHPARFGDPFTEYAVDSDSDGRYDYLLVNVSVNVAFSGRFSLSTSLGDASWNQILSRNSVYDLGAGTHVLQFRYNASDIWRNTSVQGHFHFSASMNALVDGGWYYMDGRSLQTRGYSLAQFEPLPANFLPPHSSHVSDTNGDFDYDYLYVDAVVNVTTPGEYTILVNLEDDFWGTHIDTVSNTSVLAAGQNTVRLTFPGWPIRYSGESGPYIAYMTLFDCNSVAVDWDQYTTAYYWYLDFAGPPATFVPPHSEYPVDSNSNGLYDDLVVNASVNVATAGTYSVTGTVGTIFGSIDSETNTTYLSVGDHFVQLHFPGWLVRSSTRNGPYEVDLSIYDDDSRLMDTDWFNTRAYTYNQFETLPAQFLWINATAADADADLSYDYIAINATVNVSVLGRYYLLAYVDDALWNYFAQTAQWFDFTAGVHTIQLRVPGWLYYSNGVNGTNLVGVQIYDSEQHWIDTDTNFTSAYDYTDFDSAVPRIDSVWANSAPSIDGVFGAAEWAGAASVDLLSTSGLNFLEGRLLVKNNGTMLFLCYDAFGDTTDSNGDVASIAFDTGNDNVQTLGKEDVFVLQDALWNAQIHYCYNGFWYNLHCSPFDDLMANHAGLQGATGFGSSTSHPSNHRLYEFAIPLDLLGMVPGDVIGFLGAAPNTVGYNGIYDSTSDNSSSWPSFGLNTINQYGELKLAVYVPPVPPPVTTCTLAGTAGSSGWYVSGVTATLSATGGDGGVSKTQYRLDGGTWTDYAVPLKITTNGTHTLEFKSLDNAFQWETSKSVTIKVDAGLPVTASGTSGGSVWLNATDDISGVAQVMYRIDGGTWQVYSGKFVITDEGEHTIEFYGVDAAGNQEVTKSVTVNVIGASSGTPSTALLGLSSMAWLAILAAIVVGVLLLVLFLTRRKKQTPAQAAPAQTAPEVVSQDLPPPPTP